MISIVTWVSISLLLLCLYITYSFLPPKNIRHLPSVPVIPHLLAALQGMPSDRRLEKFISPLLYKHKVVRFWHGRWTVVIEDPELIRHVFTETNIFQKEPLKKRFPEGLARFMVGDNFAFISGNDWKRQRKVVNPGLKRKWPIGKIMEVNELMIRAIERSNLKLNVGTLMKNVTLDNLGKAVFDVDFKASEIHQGPLAALYNRSMEGINNPLYMIFPFLEKLPLNSRQESWESVRQFRALLEVDIEMKRKHLKNNVNEFNSSEQGLLSSMIQNGDILDEHGNPAMTTNELIDNFASLLIAGHDTTAATISFALFHLATNPDIQERARGEIFKVVGDSNVIPTDAQCQKLVYLTALIQETMRSNPAIQHIARQVSVDTVLTKDAQLHEHQILLLDLHSSLNNPNRWMDPKKFNPSRFIKLNSITNCEEIDQVLTRDWFPFGGMARLCVGIKFSLLEQKLVLISILTRYKVRLPKDTTHIDPITNKPKLLVRSTNLAFPNELIMEFERL